MTIRRIIDLIESAADENITHRIAAEVGGGSVEGFNPYWKLTADPRVLEDMAALDHISTLIMDGFTSGIHPTWELKLIDNSEAVDEDVLLPAGTPDVSGADVEPPLEATDEMIDEEVIDIVHAYSVVPVAETHGKGKGWYEVSKAEATHFVVEDEEGHMVEHHPTYEAAKVAADIMNQNTTPADMKAYAPKEEIIDEEADEMVDDTTDTPTRFDKSQDFVVIINAIHERGVRQQEALTELSKRGLWLSAEQKKQAGLE